MRKHATDKIATYKTYLKKKEKKKRTRKRQKNIQLHIIYRVIENLVL